MLFQIATPESRIFANWLFRRFPVGDNPVLGRYRVNSFVFVSRTQTRIVFLGGSLDQFERLLVITLNSHAGCVQIAKRSYCCGTSCVRGLAYPVRCDLLISLYPSSAKIESPEIELRSHKTRDRSPKVPLGSFSQIRGASDTDFIKVSEVGLSYGITSVGGHAIPMHRFLKVPVHALSELKRHPEAKLRPDVACSRFLR
jgi:hypothetical protein